MTPEAPEIPPKAYVGTQRGPDFRKREYILYNSRVFDEIKQARY